MWQREFITANTLDHTVIYSALPLLFSLTVNGFDWAEILLAPPSISLAWSLSPPLYLTSSLQNGAKNGKYVGAEKTLFCVFFFVWVREPSLSPPQKLYSSPAVIQLHPWPWSYCCRLNGGAFTAITVIAALSTSENLQRLSPTKTPGTLSAYRGDSYMDIQNACASIIH